MMGDPLGSSRVSSQKQNREGVVETQSEQYRATAESNPGCDENPDRDVTFHAHNFLTKILYKMGHISNKTLEPLCSKFEINVQGILMHTQYSIRIFFIDDVLDMAYTIIGGIR